uniref:Uncharacterized protein n=1 Tax=Tetranychus urticae TaxID=32264 RepID=T1KR72_TETUR
MLHHSLTEINYLLITIKMFSINPSSTETIISL